MLNVNNVCFQVIDWFKFIPIVCFCFSSEWDVLFWFGVLNRVLIFVCLILKKGRGFRPWVVQYIYIAVSKFMGVPPYPPPPRQGLHI